MYDVETINELEGERLIDALEERAAQILNQIGSTSDATLIRSLGAQAQDLIAQIPPGANGGTARNRIDEAIAEAEQRAAAIEGETDASLFAANATSLAFQNQVYQFMSKDEETFFDQFDSSKQYSMAAIDENGNITTTDKKVSGAQLKEDFARIKYHTLSEEQQEGITLPDGTRAKNMTPQQEMQQLEKLEESLDHMEGYKAQKLMDEGASKDECKRCHQQFERARGQVRSLRGSIEKREALEATGRTDEAKIENNMVSVKRGILKQTLQKDVIDDALLDKEAGSRGQEVSGGHHVDDGMSNQLTAHLASIGETLRQNGMGRGGD